MKKCNRTIHLASYTMSELPISDVLSKAYEDYSDAIFRFCYVRLGNREHALDFTQETFIKTWEYLRGGKEVEKIRPFLYRVATNIIIDHSRKKKESSLDHLMNQGFDIPTGDAGKLHDALDVKYLIRIVSTMDEKYREAILLRYVDDLSIQEIATIVGESENVVSVRIHRGIQQVKTEYKKKNG